jgi:hypothetical protein
MIAVKTVLIRFIVQYLRRSNYIKWLPHAYGLLLQLNSNTLYNVLNKWNSKTNFAIPFLSSCPRLLLSNGYLWCFRKRYRWWWNWSVFTVWRSNSSNRNQQQLILSHWHGCEFQWNVLSLLPLLLVVISVVKLMRDFLARIMIRQIQSFEKTCCSGYADVTSHDAATGNGMRQKNLVNVLNISPISMFVYHNRHFTFV